MPAEAGNPAFHLAGPLIAIGGAATPTVYCGAYAYASKSFGAGILSTDGCAQWTEPF